jgi:hypothetical protein
MIGFEGEWSCVMKSGEVLLVERETRCNAADGVRV